MKRSLILIMIFFTQNTFAQISSLDIDEILNNEQKKGNEKLREVNERVKKNLQDASEKLTSSRKNKDSPSISSSADNSLNKNSFIKGKYPNDIEIPLDIIEKIDCKGNYNSLSRILPAYTTYDIANLRSDILNISIPSVIMETKNYLRTNNSINLNSLLQDMKKNANSKDDTADQALKMASATWGGPGEDIAKQVYSKRLPLNYNCSNKEPSIVAASVCAAIVNRMGSVVDRFTGEVIKKCL